MSLCLDDNFTVADFQIVGIHGQRGLGFYRLCPSLLINLNPRPEDKPLFIVDIAGQGAITRIGDPQSHVIGSFTVPRGFVSQQFPRSSSTSVPFGLRPEVEFELNQPRLQAIEDVRVGGELLLKVTLRVRFMDGTGKIHDVGDEQSLHVNQATWIKVLEQMGYGRRMLIEVPIPDQAAQPEMAKTIECLAKADAALRRGEWREAVGQCRDVMEALAVAMNDNDHTDPMFNPLFANSQGMDMNARLLVLRRALKLFTHPARHMGANSVGYDWRRSDAIAILNMVSALIQKLNEPKP